jgi:hypothetical protein
MAVHFNPAGNNNAAGNDNEVGQEGAAGALLPLNLGQFQLDDEGLQNWVRLPNLQPLDLGQVGPINVAALGAIAHLAFLNLHAGQQEQA